MVSWAVLYPNTRSVTLLQCFVMIHLQGEHQIQYARITYQPRALYIQLWRLLQYAISLVSRFVETLTLYANIFKADYKLKFISYARANNCWCGQNTYTNIHILNIYTKRSVLQVSEARHQKSRGNVTCCWFGRPKEFPDTRHKASNIIN